MFCSDVETVKARKEHVCTWCGEKILTGASYLKWTNVDDCWFTNKMHPLCDKARAEDVRQLGEGSYIPYENERPAPFSQSFGVNAKQLLTTREES